MSFLALKFFKILKLSIVEETRWNTEEHLRVRKRFKSGKQFEREGEERSVQVQVTCSGLLLHCPVFTRLYQGNIRHKRRRRTFTPSHRLCKKPSIHHGAQLDKSTEQRKSAGGESRGPHTILSDPPSNQHNGASAKRT